MKQNIKYLALPLAAISLAVVLIKARKNTSA